MHYQPMKTKQQVQSEKEIKAQSRRRLYIVGFIVVFVLISVSIALLSSRSSAAVQGEELSIVVYPGDTLWTIAAEYRGRTEIRRFIEQIRQANDLAHGHIYPGQVLNIPQGR